MSRFQVIFFNAGGTLIQLKNTTIPNLYSSILSSILKKTISPQDIYIAFRNADTWTLSRRNLGSLFSDLDQRKYQNIFYHSLGIKSRKEINRIERELAEQLEMEFVLEDGAFELLNSLENYKLGIISNWDESLRDILEELEIIDFFDSITISSEIGIGKPDHEIFKSALSDFPEFKSKNAIYLGDEYLMDILPAQELNIFAILFDKGPTGMHGIPYQKDKKCISIKKLSEFKEVLKNILKE